MAIHSGMLGGRPPSNNNDLLGDDYAPAPAAAAMGDEDEMGGTDEPTMLFHVYDNHDGSYSLVTGDEPEDAALAAPEGASPAAGGTPAMPPGQTFDGAGPLLKGILDILRSGDAESDGGQASFEDGFTKQSQA